MKNILNKFTLGVALLFATLTLKAAPFVVTFSGTNNSAIITQGSGTLKEASVFNPTTNTAIVQFIDCPTNVVTWTNAAYTNYTLSIVTATNIFTNYFGVITTNTYSAETNAPNAVLGSTNNYRVVAILVVPPLGTSRVTNDILCVAGLFATNTLSGTASNLVVNVNYSKY